MESVRVAVPILIPQPLLLGTSTSRVLTHTTPQSDLLEDHQENSLRTGLPEGCTRKDETEYSYECDLSLEQW